MGVRERVLAARVIERIKQNPGYAEGVGISGNMGKKK